ncbi:flagellar protein FlaG [Azospirillum agricola]|uniref:flagellar protein FlaG n=1 Tax=Azospirillum agricola TaxID=1720247 RepID=UPI001177692D|nr:flagellar protein FlaG [Azospirillum agricola]
MNVATATSTASGPSPFMMATGGGTVGKAAEALIPDPIGQVAAGQTGNSGTEPLVNRFPSIAFSYDVDASRLVMLYRDPANGKTVSQIPTEAALKQYKEAQEQERTASRAATLRVTVGGSDSRGGDGVSQRDANARTPMTTPATAGGSAPPSSSSGAAVSVAHFSPATTRPAAASTGVARVNVVI